MLHTSYRGKISVKTTGSKYRDWVAYTVVVGMLPLVIRLLLANFLGIPVSFEDVRTELFFVTIVLLVDALRNFRIRAGMWALVLFVLIASAAVYAVVLGIDLDLYKTEIKISSENINRNIRRFLLAGIILDTFSVGMGGESNV